MRSGSFSPFLVFLISLSAAVCPVFAATRTVSNLNDSGAGSLRAQIAAAAANDTINFSVTGTITLTSGEILINKNLTITGPGAASLTVARSSATGTAAFRVFDISNGTTTGPTVSISGLTLTNGLATGSPPANLGGAIYSSRGTVTLTNCVFTGNNADYGSGACNFSNGAGNASMTVTGCTFSGNNAVWAGGALYNVGGTLNITASNFTGNTGNHYGAGGIYQIGGSCFIQSSTFTGNNGVAGGSGQGGAISNGSTTGGTSTVNIIESTFSGNTAAGGGAIYNAAPQSGTASVTLTNCTLADNTSLRDGAAAWNDAAYVGATSNLTFYLCTLSGNHPTGDVGSVLLNFTNFSSSNLTLTLAGTIIYKAPGTSGTNIAAGNTTTVTSLGFNLCSDNGSGLLTGNNDQINTDPKLDPLGLQNNGGVTQTIALMSGSPAIDKGYSFAVTEDQRQHPRPIDNTNIPNVAGADGSDIGAFETSTDPLQSGDPSFVVTTADDHDDGQCTNNDCTLREAINRSNAIPGSNVISFPSFHFLPLITGTIVLQNALGELALTDAAGLTINGPGSGILAVSGNGAHRVFNVSAGQNTITGLTIRDGLYQTSSFIQTTSSGGGIFNSASLTLAFCFFANNQVRGGAGAIGAPGGDGQGGAIYNSGLLVISGSAFGHLNGSPGVPANAALGGLGGAALSRGGVGGRGGNGRGAGIYNGANASLTVTNSTFEGNAATGGNGNTGASGGNGDGGAIYNLGTMSIVSATITANTGTGGSAGSGGKGSGTARGGVATGSGSSSTIGNTIVAGNHSSGGGGNDVDGAFTSNGFNLIGTAFFSTGFSATGDQTGTDTSPINPQLVAGYNGVFPLLRTSPALDRGHSFSLTTDQRGSPRPVDTIFSNASGSDGSDIGAVEMNVYGGIDSDGDGMSDDFELLYGLNPADATDAAGDADGDGFTNLQEFQAGTNPLDPNSDLQITAELKTGTDFTVTFATTVPGKMYRLERKDALNTDPSNVWTNIVGLPDFTATSIGSAQLNDNGGASSLKHFYRIRLLP